MNETSVPESYIVAYVAAMIALAAVGYFLGVML